MNLDTAGVLAGDLGVLLAPAAVVLVVVALRLRAAVLEPPPQPTIDTPITASRSSENAVVRALELIGVTITAGPWRVNELRRDVSH
jgi:hypothetical protein